MVRIFKNIFLWLAGHFLAIAVVTLLILSIGPLVHYVKSSENQEASLKEDCLKWTKRIEYKTKELSSMRRLLWMKQRDILQKEVELDQIGTGDYIFHPVDTTSRAARLKMEIKAERLAYTALIRSREKTEKELKDARAQLKRAELELAETLEPVKLR